MTVAPRHVLPCNGWCCNPWKISSAGFFRRSLLAITLLLDSWLGITTENPGSHYKYLAYLGLDNSFLFLPRSLCGDVCGHYSNGKPTQPVETCWAKCFLIWTISIPQHMCHYHNRHHHYHCHHYHHYHHRDHEQVKPGERVVFNCKVDLSCMVSTIRWWAWRLLWFLNMIILVGGLITKVFNYKGSFYHCLMLQLLIIEVFDILHIMVSNFESFNKQTYFDYF